MLSNYSSRHKSGVVVTRIPEKSDPMKRARALREAKELAYRHSDPYAHGWRPYYGPNGFNNRRRTYQPQRFL